MIDIRVTVLLCQLINCASTDTKNLIAFPSKLRLVGLNCCTHSYRKVWVEFHADGCGSVILKKSFCDPIVVSVNIDTEKVELLRHFVLLKDLHSLFRSHHFHNEFWTCCWCPCNIISRVEEETVPFFLVSQINCVIVAVPSSNFNKKLVSSSNKLKNSLDYSILIKLRGILLGLWMKILIGLGKIFNCWNAKDTSHRIKSRFQRCECYPIFIEKTNIFIWRSSVDSIDLKVKWIQFSNYLRGELQFFICLCWIDQLLSFSLQFIEILFMSF